MSVKGQIAMRKAAAGFTLLELLVASAIFALLVGALFSVFSGAIRLRERAFDNVERDIPATLAIQVIKRDLMGMTKPVSDGTMLSQPITGISSRGSNHANDYLEFCTTSASVRDNIDEPWGDMQKIAYILKPSENRDAPGMELVREVTRNLLATTTPIPDDQPLLDGVDSLQIDYLSEQQWYDTWDSSANEEAELPIRPEAVKIRIDFIKPQPGQASQIRLRHPIEITCQITSDTLTATPTPTP